MESNWKSQMQVGIFLAIGLIAVLVSILLLGGDRAFFKKHVILYAQLEQVQGLNKGSIISVSGLTAGNVRDISFSTEKKSLVVTMRIQEEYLSRITKGSIADIRTQGALGDKYIYITPGDPTASPLKDQDFVETAKSSDIFGIISEKGGEAAKIFEIIDEVYKLTKIINYEGRSDKLMTNLVEASQNFKSTTEETKKLISELRTNNSSKIKEAVDHLNSVMAKLDKGEGTLGALINDPSLHERLKALLGSDSRKNSIQSLIRTSIEKSEKN